MVFVFEGGQGGERMKRQIRLGVGFGVLAVTAVACGGEGTSKPPETPPHAAPATTASDDPGASSPGRNIEGPAAPSSSDDVKKGIAALKAGDVNGAKAAFEVAVQKNP